MTAIVQVPEWHDRANCAGVPTYYFYPEKGSGIGTLAAAKQVCARCEVKPECLAYAVESAEPYGVWGGTSESERRRIRGLARAKAARLLREAGETP